MILVTGANGFIGSALVGELNQKGYQDLVLTDVISLEERPQLLRGKAFREMLGPMEALTRLKEGRLKPQWIFHMGACSDTTETRWDYLLKLNVHYTQELFQWCSQNQVPLIYASSGAVYGDGSAGFSDRLPPQTFTPLNLYGKSKLLVDEWVMAQSQLPPHWYGLRFFNVYGPNESFKGAMASVAFKAYGQIKSTGQLKLFKSQHPDYKDGEQKRDFVYVKDVVRWMTELMDKKPSSGIYNMGSGRARTWLDLASQCFKSLGEEMKIQWVDLPEELRSRYQYFTEAPMERWKEQSLSAPKHTLESGVADYIVEHLEKGKFL